MLLLALDTALSACSACLYDSVQGKVLRQESLIMDKGHAEALMPLVERLLAESGTDPTALDRIVTSVGPGSFTGLRVGISAARGLALAIGCDCVGVSTLSAFAAPFITAQPDAPVACAIDARHDNVFFTLIGPGGKALIAPALTPARDAAEAARNAQASVVTGNGTHLLSAYWMSDPDQPRLAPAAFPSIEWIARLGALATPEQAPPAPLYLRAPEAHVPADAALPRR